MAKLNVQGLSRKDLGLMSTIVADPGKLVISADLSAGEPTVTSHFSQDKNYYAACFGMVGVAPYYQNGNLYIDDLYLMTASKSPLAKDTMREAFNTTWSGLTFSEQWLTDADVIKKQLKATRDLHKLLALGLSYSMGPKKLVKSAYEKGYTLDYKTAKEFYNSYWELFSGVRRLGEQLQARFKLRGYLVNPFMYRIIPDSDYKCLNYFIQSSVSGIMNVLCAKFFAICKDAEFITIIHDELVAQVSIEKEPDARALWQSCVDSLNDELKWSVLIRSGWVAGRNFYEAK